MARIVAGLYEIQQKIGAGGGGVVYLGRHLRLNKRVVLKADKRSLNVKPEILRREVDMLKGLSHTYIPQVYDFVQEDGIVYTVMDYIDGESLDHILDRGQTPPQSQLIHWACQILEALSYLHSRPPHGILHADIKPANIMLRPNGDICLIDYNIALALGEDGAVKVGYSSGYASPEHYGSNFKLVAGTISEYTDEGKRAVKLDVRSDIYSLGATLYHLISGIRPAQNALEVKPLGAEICSPAVADIIRKAMAPDSESRYQTADEMLSAFHQLHVRDPRMVRYRKQKREIAIFLITCFLAGGAGTFVGLKQMEQRQTSRALAEYSENEQKKGNISEAVNLALQAIPTDKSILNAPVTAEAQKALTDALGVYDLTDRFKSMDFLKLSAIPYKVIQSPDGNRVIAVYRDGAGIFDIESKTKIAELTMIDSALADAIFVNDNQVLYAGKQGVSLYDIQQNKDLWSAEDAVFLAVSGDKKIVATIKRGSEKAILYQISDGQAIGECSLQGHQIETAFNDIFADPQNQIFALNQDGTMLAVTFADGALIVFNIQSPEDDLIMYEESAYTGFEGDFCGKYFAFVAQKSDQSVFGIIDTEEGTYIGEIESRSKMHVKTDERGIWLSEENLLVCFDPETLEDKEIAFTDQMNISGFATGDPYILTLTDDPGFSFYGNGAKLLSHETLDEPMDFCGISEKYAILANRNQPQIRLMRRESHEDSTLFFYDAEYLHDEARISSDEKTVMLFSYEGFQIYDQSGKKLAEGEFPDKEQIYDQQFRRKDGDSWLDVIWYDGTVRSYRASNGELISEKKEEAPSKDLHEEFETENYRFVSELHQAPVVYNRATGKMVKELEKDAYLTYVTETDGYLITEYVTADGERYGLLLNQDLETLARLPGLCDVVNDKLIFDYQMGELRQSRFYSLQELTALGELYKKDSQ